MSGTYGPKGLDKMLYKSNGETAVTNDGAKIISELLVKHPAAKAFVQLAQTQEEACGNGVTTCVLIASELMREAGRLLERHLHPLVLVEGYHEALAVALDYVVRHQVQWQGDLSTLRQLAKTALAGTTAESQCERLAACAVEAMEQVGRKNGAYLDIRMTKMGHGSLGDSQYLPGLILKVALGLDRLPRFLATGKLLTLTCPLGYEETSRDLELEVGTAEQWASFIEAKEHILHSKLQKIREQAPQAIFCSQSIDPFIYHELVKDGRFVLANLDTSMLEDIAIGSGAFLCDHLDDLEPDMHGDFTSLEVQTTEGLDGRVERLHLVFGKNSKRSTIDVGGDDGVACEEIIRSLHDALRTIDLVYETPTIIQGAGAPYMGMALAIRDTAAATPGRKSIAMEAFARALEIIPATLARNAGASQLDTLLELRAAHREGRDGAGIDDSGKVIVMADVWEPTTMMMHALQAATDVACGLLRVDQVISARGD